MNYIFILQDKLSFLWEIGIPFLVALTVLVFVHEFGHYIVARWCGVRVETFSVGFGNELKGWTDKYGTRWKIAAIPLGGYVKMFGEKDEIDEVSENGNNPRSMTQEEKEVSFFHKSLLQRALIVFAGPFINFVFAVILLGLLYSTLGVPSPVSNSLLAVVGNVSGGSAASHAGIRSGDRIDQIDNTSISYFSDLQRIVRASPNKPLTFRITRNHEPLVMIITPGLREWTNDAGQKETIGVLGISASTGEVKYQRQSPLTALSTGIERTYFMTTQILLFIGEIFVGNQSTDELGGIIRIAKFSGQAAEMGIHFYISFLAILSINLGLINLFPIPLLDGGHLVFYIFEAFRGRPLGPKVQEYSLRLGLAIVIALFVFVTWNDLEQEGFFKFISEIFG